MELFSTQGRCSFKTLVKAQFQAVAITDISQKNGNLHVISFLSPSSRKLEYNPVSLVSEKLIQGLSTLQQEGCVITPICPFPHLAKTLLSPYPAARNISEKVVFFF